MIPDLIDINSPWKVLPPGIHLASLSEIEACYAFNPVRRDLFRGLTAGFKMLQAANCKKVLLDGSFVTGKPEPGDFDACWETIGVDSSKVDPVLFDFSNKRAAQKAKYKGEFFPAYAPAERGVFFINFFQRDRYTHQSKGIIQIQ